MISFLTYLGVFITCLGLWGLSSLSTEQRIKEIGVRKILGASVSGIILLLSKEFTKWVVVANIFAWPIGYFVVNKWLQNFAYRTKITADVFILSALFSLAIALITIGLQTRKMAQANPVESLRYE
jgi:putative ABC transport system permease protein